MKKVAVILSGCGVYDGSEIIESVLTLLALDRAQAQAICTAPDIVQTHVINHLTGELSEGEARSVLVESARIARGSIIPLSQLDVNEIDAVIIPGGFGVAKNLSDFATANEINEVNPEVAAVLLEAHRMSKPLGFICIAPVIAAKLFGATTVKLTVGNDAETVEAIQKTGALHVKCAVREVMVDRCLKIASTPAYMLAERPTEAEAGINKLVQAVLEMV